MSTTGSNSGRRETPPVAPAPVPELPRPLVQDVKVNIPPPFDGTRAKLRSFLSQCDLWLGFNSRKFANDIEKVLWIVALLEGPAFDWVEPFLTEYMKKRGDSSTLKTNMTDGCKDIFRSPQHFRDKINQVFGDIDQERTAERTIQNLRQKGSAATYTAEFQRYSSATGWNDDALRAQYYKGLKDHVKDEISRSDRPETLTDMIEMAVKIDNRLYERQLERKGHFAPTYGKKSHKSTKSYWPQPMELDATFRKKKRSPSKEEMDHRRKNKLCFDCGLPGHMANSHRKNNQQRRGKSQVNAIEKRQIAVIDTITPLQNTTVRFTNMTSEELEHLGISTQVEESDGPPPYDSESSDTEEEELSDVVPAPYELWIVHKYYVCSEHSEYRYIRIWRNIATNELYREPGHAPSGGPSPGETYLVKCRDQRHIGWIHDQGYKTYM